MTKTRLDVAPNEPIQAPGSSTAENAETGKRLKILLVNSSAIANAGLQLLLEQAHWPGFSEIRVLTALNIQEAKAHFITEGPDLLLVNYQLGPESGSQLIVELNRQEQQVKALLFTDLPAGGLRAEVLSCGAKGFLTDFSSERLVESLMSIYYGGFVCASSCLHQFACTRTDTQARPGLSQRERQVLKLIAEDHSREAIAAQLRLSVRTVDTYRNRLMSKLDVHSVVGLTRYALAQGISTLDPV